jgi:hypothetical protein
MTDINNQVDDTINLAGLMRAFLVGKDIPVVMGTLCLLMAETISVVGDPEVVDENVNLVGTCIRSYIEQIKGMADDAP